jgi:hypothetical protein
MYLRNVKNATIRWKSFIFCIGPASFPPMSVSTVVIFGEADTGDTGTPPPPPPSGDNRLHVADIQLTVVAKGPLKQGAAEVLVLDENSNPVGGVNVSVNWTGVVTGSAADTTGSDGIATFYSANTRKTGTLTFTITGLAKDGYTYSAQENVVTSASVEL